MRYLQSREAVAAGVIKPDEVIEGKTSSSLPQIHSLISEGMKGNDEYQE